MLTFKEIRQASGMNLKQFSEYFEIPYSTIQNWEGGHRQCPEYLLKLMEYRLKNESKDTPDYVIHNRNEDMKELHKKHEQLQKERFEAIRKRKRMPTAEWIQTSSLCNPYCSACKQYNDRKSSYCPNCGKEMGNKKEGNQA